MSRIAYACNGKMPNCSKHDGCFKTCGHTTDREYSLHYKTHKPTEAELEKYFIVFEDCNGVEKTYMEKIFEEGRFE